MLDIRDGTNANVFSMDDLFLLLQVGAQNLDDATVLEDLLKELWKESPNNDLRSVLDSGIADILAGNHESALTKFNEIIASDPRYGHAWNEKVSCPLDPLFSVGLYLSMIVVYRRPQYYI